MAKKSTEHRLKELKTSLDAIQFAYNQFMTSGHELHFLSLKTQLRALIATGGRNMKPLLFELADKANVDLIIHAAPLSEKPNDVDWSDPNNVFIDVPFSKSWSTKAQPTYLRMSFREWMQADAFSGLYTEGYVSRNRILRELADTEGAHFDENIRELINYVDSQTNPIIGPQGNPIALRGIGLFLLDLAAATQWMGYRFLLKANQDFSRIKDLDEEYEKLQIGNGFMIRMSMVVTIAVDPTQEEDTL